MTITIENISGRDIDIKSHSSFELVREGAARNGYTVVGDSYWSPVNLSDSSPRLFDLEKLKKEGFVKLPNKSSLHLAKNEAKTFYVDLTKFLWNDSMLGQWPQWSLFEVVPKGTYGLQFRIQVGQLKSSQVTVTVQ